jgi:hypothetical protein
MRKVLWSTLGAKPIPTTLSEFTLAQPSGVRKRYFIQIEILFFKASSRPDFTRRSRRFANTISCAPRGAAALSIWL